MEPDLNKLAEEAIEEVIGEELKEEFDIIVSTIDYKGFEKLFDKYMKKED